MVDGSKEASRGRRQVSGQRQRRHGGQALVGAGRVRELDRDGVHATLGYVVVQLLDGALRLRPLVEADETHSFGQTCSKASKDSGGQGRGPGT